MVSVMAWRSPGSEPAALNSKVSSVGLLARNPALDEAGVEVNPSRHGSEEGGPTAESPASRSGSIRPSPLITCISGT